VCNFFGSSRILLQSAWEGAFDLRDEAGVVAEAVRLPLDELDLVADAFQSPCVERIKAVVYDPLLVSSQVPPEGSQRSNAALLSQRAPVIERFRGHSRIATASDLPQPILEDVEGVQRLIHGKEPPSGPAAATRGALARSSGADSGFP
jgi:hypothetical protein